MLSEKKELDDVERFCDTLGKPEYVEHPKVRCKPGGKHKHVKQELFLFFGSMAISFMVFVVVFFPVFNNQSSIELIRDFMSGDVEKIESMGDVDDPIYPIITYSSSWIDYEYENGTHTRTLYSGTMFTQEVDNNWYTLPEVSSFTWTDGCFNFSYRNYWVHIEPFVVYNGNDYTLQEIKNFFPNINIRDYIKPMKFQHKFALNFSNVPQNLIDNTDYFGFRLKEAHGLTWDDVQKTSNHSIVIKNKVEINYQDLLESNFTLSMPDKRTLLIGNISNNSANGIIYLDPYIILQDADTENLEDTFATENKPDSPQNVRVQTWDPGYYISIKEYVTKVNRGYLIFDISSIPSDSTITDSTLYLYKMSYSGGEASFGLIEIYHVTDITWDGLDEDSMTWNNQVCGVNFDDSGDCNLNSEDSYDPTIEDNVWYDWTVTQAVTTSYNAEDGAVSFALKSDSEDAGNYYIFFYSKEWATTSLRPYLNITYTAPPPPWSNVCPVASGEHPTNGSSSIGLQEAVGCTITDGNSNHSMNVTFATNVSGGWVNFQTNNSVGNNSAVNWTYTQTNTELTKYYWRVYVHDGICNQSFTYFYTTGANVTESWQVVDDTYNGVFENSTVFKIVSDSYDGVFQNQTQFKIVSDTYDGTFHNVTEWAIMDSVSGVFHNVTEWAIMDSVSGVFLNTSRWYIEDDTYDGIFQNSTQFKVVSDSYNGTFQNTTVFHVISDTYNGVFQNITEWAVMDSVSGVFLNTSRWYIEDDTYDGIFQNSTQFKVVSDTYNGVFQNITPFRILSNTYNGVFTNTTVVAIIITSVYPVNSSSRVPLYPPCYATFNSTYGYSMNISWYFGSTLIGTDNDITNSTQNDMLFLAINRSTTYTWGITVNDDQGNWLNETYSFTTEGFGGGRKIGGYAVYGVIGLAGLFGLVMFVMYRRKREYD